jgi:hypothetical protein
MSTYVNLGNQNVSNSIQNNYFTNYFASMAPISEESYQAIVAEFEKITGSPNSAQAIAAAIVITCRQQNIDPMETLREFAKMPIGELNAYLALFLNTSRVGTSRLGVVNQPPVNKYVQRSILP